MTCQSPITVTVTATPDRKAKGMPESAPTAEIAPPVLQASHYQSLLLNLAKIRKCRRPGSDRAISGHAPGGGEIHARGSDVSKRIKSSGADVSKGGLRLGSAKHVGEKKPIASWPQCCIRVRGLKGSWGNKVRLGLDGIEANITTTKFNRRCTNMFYAPAVHCAASCCLEAAVRASPGDVNPVCSWPAGLTAAFL